ncbi:MAG: aminoacetone oxidase family FAD-binding enzyme, partial [Lachnospiraceae bacterium]|nr:aminoacetone oxidase family FAD-binding enzyme [Lachnospiraceae bacterium]
MNVCVVGGGPAGMMAAIAAAENGNKVTLIEQNEKLGKKLFLTGKGRCNITNACPVEELFDNIVTNPKFLYSAFYGFDNGAIVDFFNNAGLKTKIERGERVFPQSDHSSDVIKALKKQLESYGVAIMLNTKVLDFAVTRDSSGINKISSVIIQKDNRKSEIHTDRLVLATGGASYPSTGSDGRMLDKLAKAGIAVRKCEPSLVPFVCNDRQITDMQGLSLKNVNLSVTVMDKQKYSGFGEMLFTHFGISGPLVLSASSYLTEEDYRRQAVAHIDLKPALSMAELDARILRDFE